MDQNYSGQGPGLSGIFIGGDPVYSYQGPLGIDEALFTPSSLNRLFTNEPANQGMPSAPQDVLAVTGGSSSSGKTPAWAKIASGDRYREQAKNINDIYSLVKEAIRLRNPKAAEEVAPLILEDEVKIPNSVAYYTIPTHRIHHPIFDQMPSAGYETNVAPYVVVNTPEGPKYYQDRFVPTSGEFPDMSYNLAGKSSLAHEIGHSLDFGKNLEDFDGFSGLLYALGLGVDNNKRPKSGYDKEIWRSVLGDYYMYPRHVKPGSNAGMTMQEAFAEHFSHAMRNDLANKYGELQNVYAEKGMQLPYELNPIEVLPQKSDGTAIPIDRSADPSPYVERITDYAKNMADAAFSKHSAPKEKMLFSDDRDTINGKVLWNVMQDAYDTTYFQGNEYLDNQVKDNVLAFYPGFSEVDQSTWLKKMDAIDPTAVGPQYAEEGSPGQIAPSDIEANLKVLSKLNTLNDALRVERAKQQAQFLNYFLNQYW